MRNYRISEAALERFISKVRFGNCWEWTGSLSGNKVKYPQFWLNSEMCKAHIVSYRWFVCNKVEHEVNHMCENNRCVNPDHLEDRPKGFNELYKYREICGNGLHPMTPDNVYVAPNGWKRCKKCRLAVKRRYNAKSRI